MILVYRIKSGGNRVQNRAIIRDRFLGAKTAPSKKSGGYSWEEVIDGIDHASGVMMAVLFSRVFRAVKVMLRWATRQTE